MNFLIARNVFCYCKLKIVMIKLDNKCFLPAPEQSGNQTKHPCVLCCLHSSSPPPPHAYKASALCNCIITNSSLHSCKSCSLVNQSGYIQLMFWKFMLYEKCLYVIFIPVLPLNSASAKSSNCFLLWASLRTAGSEMGVADKRLKTI